MLTITGLVSTVIVYLSGAYAARALGVSAVGSFYWSTYLLSYATLICGLGVPAIGQREVAKYPHLTTKLFSLTCTILICLSATGWVVIQTWSYLVGADVAEASLLAILSMALLVRAVRPTWVLQAHQRMTIPPIVSLAGDGVQLFAIVLLVQGPTDLYNYAWITVAILASKTLFEWWYIRKLKILSISTLRFRSRGSLSLVKASLPVAVSLGAITVYYNIDALMIGAAFGREEVGFYGTAYAFMLAMTVPSLSILTAHEPLLAKAGRKFSEESTAVSKKFARTLAWIGFPVTGAAFLFGQDIYLRIYGAEFGQGATYFQWLCLNIALVYVNVGLANPLISWGYQRQHMYITIASAGLNIALNAILLPWFHVPGAILATLASECFVLVAVIILRRSRRIAWFDVRPVYGPPALYTLCVIALCSGSTPTLGTVGGAVFALSVTGIFLLFTNIRSLSKRGT